MTVVGRKVLCLEYNMRCSVGCAGDCIIAMAEVCLAGKDAGLKAEAARLCASIAAMPCR